MLKFYKYHGAGNDFIMIDNRDGSFSARGGSAFGGDVKDTKNIKFLCDRHLGIGADGLILMESSEKADCFMNYYNADGTAAEMCGNGIRCLAKFFIEQTKSNLKELFIDTRDGIKKVLINKDGSFSVNMRTPVFSRLGLLDFPNNPLVLENISFNFVSMGNPHAVGVVKDISQVNISQIGPKIENNSHFPNKINVLFVEKVKDDYFKVKVWERGSGATLSCGTGACAVYAVIKSKHPPGVAWGVKEITLEFPGGNLYVSENKKGEIILRGPAMCVFKGEMI